MKKIKMTVERCGDKGWQEAGTQTFERLSRWKQVKHNYNPTKRNPLWYYATDGYGYHPHDPKFDPSGGVYLDYFTFGGRNYALEQFLALGNPFTTAVGYSWKENGEKHCLSGIDAEDLYGPLYIELGPYGESVRIYQEITNYD